jgi:hypothetical protein
MVTEETKGEHV